MVAIVTRYQKVRAEERRLLGGRCAVCGTNDEEVLTTDHRHGDGWKGKGQHRGTLWWLRIHEVRKDPSRFQLLCASCHLRKTRRAGEQALGPGPRDLLERAEAAEPEHAQEDGEKRPGVEDREVEGLPGQGRD